MTTAFLPSLGLAVPAPALALDLRTALLNGAGQMGMVRQTLAAAHADPAGLPAVQGRDAILSVVARLDAATADLLAQMNACAAVIDGSAEATRLLDRYREQHSSEAADDGGA